MFITDMSLYCITSWKSMELPAPLVDCSCKPADRKFDTFILYVFMTWQRCKIKKFHLLFMQKFPNNAMNSVID